MNLIYQIQGDYELCYEVIEMAKKLQVDTLYSIGAALRSPNLTEPKLFGIALSTHLITVLKKQKIDLLNGKEQITGFNGLILGIAKEKNIDRIYILMEIDNPDIVQPNLLQ